MPATRLAVADLDGLLVGLGRALVAALFAALALAATRTPLPPRHCWAGLVWVALGVVFGFPLLTALALTQVPAAHGAVIVGLLPAATAVMAVLRAGERPGASFWAASAVGLGAVLAFGIAQGAGGLQRADALILLAVAAGALGYAEGGRLARELGGWQVICWALVLSAPPIALLVLPRLDVDRLAQAGAAAWAGFAYVSLVSMFLGFFAWYRALAIGGVARISQLQLAQPVLTIAWSVLLLGERLTGPMLATACAVLGSVALTQFVRRPAAAPAAPPGALAGAPPGPLSSPLSSPSSNPSSNPSSDAPSGTTRSP